MNQLLSFADFLKNVQEEIDIGEDYIKTILIRKILAIESWEKVYSNIIKLTKPRYSISLVYYSDSIYGFNLAARKHGITCIDLQHGGLGPEHPAYYFSKVPKKGYNILPQTFWAWNNSSYQDIFKWSKDTPHKVIKGGNPWIGYLNKSGGESKAVLEKNKPVILFTLQPIGDIISPYFLEVILKTQDRFSWWLRFHPRMTEIEKATVLNKFKKNKGLKGIEYAHSTSSPLPLVIKECDLHISLSSGAIIEAAMMNKFSLIISKTGVNYYTKIIADGWAEPCLNEDVDEIIKKIEINLDKKNSVIKKDLIDYRRTLDALIKQ